MNDIDIHMSCDNLAKFFDIPNQGLDLFCETLPTFEHFPHDHTREYDLNLSTIILIHL